MVAMSHTFRAQWERDRERREIAELERLAAWLIALYERARKPVRREACLPPRAEP